MDDENLRNERLCALGSRLADAVPELMSCSDDTFDLFLRALDRGSIYDVVSVTADVTGVRSD